MQTGRISYPTKEIHYVFRCHSVNHFAVDVARCPSNVAAQQIMGVWTQRRVRAGSAHPGHSVTDGANLNLTLIQLISHLERRKP
jgi:hypothetical protein